MEKKDFITFWQEVHTVIDDAVEKRDRSVLIFFHPENGFSVTELLGQMLTSCMTCIRKVELRRTTSVRKWGCPW
jgi:hypothetical protein